MLNAVNIKHYKGISELELWKIMPITLIGGRNNVGKSTLLEAIFLAYDRMNPDLMMRQFGWRGIQLVQLDPDAMWKPSFYNYDLTKNIQIELKDTKNKWLKLQIKHEDNYKPTIVEPPVQPDKLPEQSSLALSATPVRALGIYAQYDGKLAQDSHLVVQPTQSSFHINKSENIGGIPTAYISSTTRSSQQEDATRFGTLDVENRTSDLIEVLRTIDKRIKGLAAVALGPHTLIHADVEGFSRKIPIALMGDGISRLLTIALAIFTMKGGLVLVDEIENGVHHSTMPAIWNALAKACKLARCQLIATTHSYECVASAHRGIGPEAHKDLCYFRLDYAKDSNLIRSVSYSSDELGVALEAELEVR